MLALYFQTIETEKARNGNPARAENSTKML